MNDPVEVNGIVRGKTIELQEELGLPDGQHVILTVRVIPPSQSTGKVHEGLLQAAGAWADGGDELDEWLKETYEARKQYRRSDPALNEE